MLAKKDIQVVINNIKRIYLEDQIPWVVGYSGGKDSTAVLQLVWNAIKELPIGQRTKKINVITNDTLVESPIVSQWVRQSHRHLQEMADIENMPFESHILFPDVKETFWVYLIGKGYPYPRKNFRWCTDRLKIKPTNVFVQNMISAFGEVILVLGTRKAESANRKKTMTEHEKYEVREFLTSKGNMQNELSYTPIKNWLDDDVWQYLLQYKNPWGHSNEELLSMYRGATCDGECPLVRSTDTPSCGNSRFGCWVCTLVEKDKSMAAMIQNDDEKAWMLPLLQFRDDFGDHETDRMRREFTRLSGNIKLYNDRLVHGPYKKEIREQWLRRLLEMEIFIQNNGPDWFKDYRLITDDELLEIRRIWLEEKYEFDDSLPYIFTDVTGQKLEIKKNTTPFSLAEYGLLKEVCDEVYGDEERLFSMTASLLEIARKGIASRYRSGVIKKLTEIVKANYYKNENDALNHARTVKNRQDDTMQEVLGDWTDGSSERVGE
ncbi:MAG: DNA phosphorothioation system sulfurtransferase DndC [Oscillospiraceae bacterium]|nr:DNA phosphorothioation system sulfurtransferase DndC [Oscillospiraceae bacterium]